MKYPLTKKQKMCFEFIKNYIQEHDMAPSYREIMKGTNTNSIGGVGLKLTVLQRKGWIKKLDASWRAIAIND